MNEIERLHARFCDYSQVFKGNKPSTIKWFRYDFTLFMRFSKLNSIREINRHLIEDWILAGKLDKNWAVQTVRLKLQWMSLFLDWCVNQEYIKENVCKKIAKPKLPQRIPKHLTLDQTLRLLEWTKHYRYYYKFERNRAVAIMATFIYTGVRKSELMNLMMEDIDVDERVLTVRNGKGGKDRKIPINLRLVRILEDYLKDRKRLNKMCPYFFTSMREDVQMGDLVLKRLFKKIREKSKIYVYPHLLRHTFATLMLEGGCDLFSLSKMLGHSDIKTTTIYLSAVTSHLKEQAEKHPLDF